MSPKVNKLSPQQLRKAKRIAAVIEKGNLGILEHLFEIEERMDKEHEDLEKKLPSLENVIDKVRGEKGEKGDKGDKGDKGEPGRDGRDGRDGQDGLDGRDGRDGKDGEMGVIDEATLAYLEEKIDSIKEEVRTVPQGRAGWGAHPLTITDGTTVIDKNARRINFGANLSVSRASDGTITVTGSAGGGGATVETPTGTVNGTNTSFTVSAEPTHVVSDGITYFAGAGYTYAALTITMDVAPSQYIRAFV